MASAGETELKDNHHEPASPPYAAAAAPEPVAADATPAEKKEEPRVSVSEVFQYADGIDRFLICSGFLSAFVSGAGMPAFSYVFGRMINELVSSGNSVETQLAKTSFIMTMVGLVVLVLQAYHVGALLVAANRQIIRIRTRFFSSVMRQDMAWHDEHKPGELTSRMTGDTRVIQNGINDKLSQGFNQLGMGIFGFGFGFYYSWQLTLVMFGTMPLIAAAGAVMANVMTAMTEASRAHFAKAGSIATEVMENIRTVQVFGREDFETERFTAAALEAQKAGIKKEFAANLSIGVTYGIMFSSYAVAFFFASYLIEWGDNDVGEITATFFSVLMGSFGFGLVFPSITAFTEARAAAHKVYEIVNRVPDIDIDKAGVSISTINEAIEFRNVEFSYPTRRDQKLFTNLNVTIRRGQKVAFSGASGCGKSSIIGLLQRFYDPISGGVFVDGVDLRTITLQEWRGLIGIVSQEPSLFSGSMLDNVRVGKEDATLEEVIEACKRANIHETIEGLPDKYDTSVGTVGSQLSGGQKQRLAIARAIVSRPKLLILDEATSALDRKSEVEVQAALDALMNDAEGMNMTVVVIAHRLATIRNVDTIYYISYDGVKGSEIAETGTFDELMALGGQFAVMANKQGAASPQASPASPEAATARSPGKSARHADVEEEDGGADVDETTEAHIAGIAAEKMRRDVRNMPLEKVCEYEIEHTDVPSLRILQMNRENLWAVVLGLLGSIISGGVYPVYAVVLGKMLGVLGENANDIPELRHQTSIWGSLFIAIGVGAFFGWFLQAFYGYAGEHLTTKIRQQLFRNILRQDQTFFDTPGRDAGALSGVLSGDCEAVHQLWGPSIGFKVQLICNIVAGLAIGFAYMWKLAFVTLATLPIMIATGAIQQMLLVGFGHEAEKNVDSITSETMGNIRTVAAFNLQRRQLALYEKTNAETLPTQIRNSIIIGIVWGFTQFSFFGVFALAFWYGGKLIGQGEGTFTDVIITAMAVLMGAMGAGEAGGFAAKLADAQAAAKRVFSVLDRKPNIDPYIRGDREFGTGCRIQLEGVKFVYPARPKQVVLKSVDVAIENGMSVGLMGQTGCGKSTIIQLLARFYNPARGHVLINGKPLSDIDIQTWRENVSIVLQEPNLFSGSVRENIRYSRLDATDEEVEQAAKLAAIHDDIMKMPQGYNTDVGYKGRALSGGQKQRVAIARGLLRKPRLLLLDEATSALDNATEGLVQRGIDAARAAHPCVVVAVAHRLTTIKDSSKIILLHEGEVLEEGTHDELMALNGEYKARWELYNSATQ